MYRLHVVCGAWPPELWPRRWFCTRENRQNMSQATLDIGYDFLIFSHLQIWIIKTQFTSLNTFSANQFEGVWGLP